MQPLTTVARSIWGGIVRLWGRGCLGKIAVGFLALIVISVCVSPFTGGRRSNTPAAGVSTTVTGGVAQQATQAPEPTRAAEPTAIPATAAPTATATPAPTPTPLPAIGQMVSVGRLNWQVTKVTVLGQRIESGNQFVAALVTSGQFIDIRYYVENTGNDPIYGAGDLRIIDDKGRTFQPARVLDIFIDEPCNTSVSLNPGLSTTCEAIYDMPADAKGLKLEVTGRDGILQDTIALIDLGL